MVKDIPNPPRLSTRAVLAIGLCSDALAVPLYYTFVKASFGDTQTLGFKLLGLALCLALLFGLVGTFVGGAMWARRASNRTVLLAALAVVCLTLIYANSVRFGFDDPRVLVLPFGGLVVLLLVVGRAIGYVTSHSK